MSKKILVAQNIKELKYLIKNTKDKFRVLPLNLKTQLFCISKNIKFINLSRILDNDIHKDIIIETEKILNKINTLDLSKKQRALYEGITLEKIGQYYKNKEQSLMKM